MCKVGQTIKVHKEITDELIRNFAKVSTDYNPIHLDDDYASNTRFGKRIAHGMISASFVSAIIGNEFPGPGTIYLEQTLKFISPIYIGDIIEIQITIEDIDGDQAMLSTNVFDQYNKKKIIGKAVVLLP